MPDGLVEGQDFAPFYRNYIERSISFKLIQGLMETGESVLEVMKTIPDNAMDSTYAQGKWSVSQLIQHINDTERIFAYRACVIARGEEQAIRGYDQDIYAKAELNMDLALEDMVDEFEYLRKASVILFKGLNETALSSRLEVSGGPMSVRAIGFMMIGHALHHMDVLNSRYSPLWNRSSYS